MKCPWGCGWEGVAEEYIEHLRQCPKYLLQESREYLIEKPEAFSEQTPRLLAKIYFGIPNKDRLLQEAFDELNALLNGPPLVLEIHRKKRYYAAVDGYAGIEGKVILTINQSKIDQIYYDTVGAMLIHEILHQLFPEDLEIEIQRKTEESWKTLFPTTPFPSEDFQVWLNLRKWERRAGMEI